MEAKLRVQLVCFYALLSAKLQLLDLQLIELRLILDHMALLVNVPVSDGAAPRLNGDSCACCRCTRILERCRWRSCLAIDCQACAAALDEK